MIAVISELWPHDHRRDDYFALSKALYPLLERVDGFISAERFESTAEKGKYLSFSLWRDEKALADWRNLEEHRLIMAKGRDGILRDYTIRVTEVKLAYSMTRRDGAPLER